LENGSAEDGISRMWKTLATRGSAAPGSVYVPALSGSPVGLETAALEYFAEPATLGWPAAPFRSKMVAPESVDGI
jgi:hypothetical protein